MTTVTAGSAASYTLTTASTILVSPDPNEVCEVSVLRGAARVYGAAIKAPTNIGPFQAGDVFALTAARGDADYTVNAYTDPASVSGAGKSTVTADDTGSAWARCPALISISAVMSAGTSATVLLETRDALGTVATGVTMTFDTVAQILRTAFLTREAYEYRIRRVSGTGTVAVTI